MNKDEPLEEIFVGIIGASEDLARAKAMSNGFDVRVTHRDNESFMCTMELRPDRMNFHIQDGVVIEAYIG